MTEGLQNPPAGSYGPHSRPAPCTDEGLSTKKTVIVLMIIGACFAILWPKIFYPMLVGNTGGRMKPHRGDIGCCDVISEVDLDTIKIMSELCSTIIESKGAKPPTGNEIVQQCRRAVLETCGIDIAAALQDRVSLGHSTKQILEEVRSLNGSLCLKYHFGVSPWQLGVPRKGAGALADPVNNIRQERSSQLRPAGIHPAFRERGRAIPEAAESLPIRRTAPPPRIIEGRPGPIPGMRPTMGGPGHVVAPSKQANYGFMGVLMPLYTIGFVIFFAYTVMKLVFKKKPENHSGAPLYPPCDTDEDFRHEVFEQRPLYFDRPNKDTSKIGPKERDAIVNAVAALLEEVNKEIETHKSNTPSDSTATEQEIIKPNGSLPKEEDQGSITVMGMETTASSESGKKWSRPDSPMLPHPQPIPKEPTPPPQQIFLETALPAQSQLLVSEVEAQKDSEDDSPVVLAGKMTLSVISLDSEDSGGKEDEERRTSSSNASEEFEKINVQDLENQDKAEDDEISPVELPSSGNLDVLEEIRQQLQLEDDLLEVLKKESVPLETSSVSVVEQVLQSEADSEPDNLTSFDDEEDQKEETSRPSSGRLFRLEEPTMEKILREELQRNDDLLEVLQKESVPLESSSVSDIVEQVLQSEADLEPDNLTSLDDEEDQKEETSRPSSGRLFRLGEPTMEEILREELQRNEDLDMIEQVIEEIHYEDDDDEDDEDDFEEEERRLQEEEKRVNGVAHSEGSSRNGAEPSETAAENDISENELDGSDEEDDEEIEEIIEYVDNTDEEGEEIIEVNGNEARTNRNGNH